MSQYCSSARCTVCPWSWVADSDDDLANANAEIAAEQHVDETRHEVMFTQILHPGP